MAPSLSQAWKILVARDPEAIVARQEHAWNSKDNWSMSVVGKPRAFKELISSVAYGWQANLVTPNPYNKNEVLLLHHCFTFTFGIDKERGDPGDSFLLGFEGISAYAGVRALAVNDLVKPVTIKSRRRFDKKGAPSVDDFFRCNSPEEFANMVDASGNASDDFEGSPNHFWVDPALFYAVFDKNKAMENDPAVAAYQVIEFLRYGDSGAHKEIGGTPDGPGELFHQAYPFLKFLWGAKRGVFDEIGNYHTPLHDEQLNQTIIDMTDKMRTRLQEIEEEDARQEAADNGRATALNDSAGAPEGPPVAERERGDDPSTGSPRPDLGGQMDNYESEGELSPDDDPRGEQWSDLMKEVAAGQSGQKESRPKAKGKASERPQSPTPLARVDHDRNPAPSETRAARKVRTYDYSSDDDSEDDQRPRPTNRGETRYSGRSDEAKAQRHSKRGSRKAPDHSPPGSSDSSDSDYWGSEGRKVARIPGRAHKKHRREPMEVIAAGLEMMAQTQARYMREQREHRSLLGNLPDAQRKLFRLLNVPKMREGLDVPRLSALADQIDRGTRPRQVVSNIRYEVREIGGDLSESGFANFITSGFYNQMVFDKPGGFTALMFRPKDSLAADESLVERKRRLRELFGTRELSEAEVEVYAKQDYYIAESVDKLVKQLKICKRVMSMLTCPGGVGTEIYSRVINLLKNERDAASAQFRQDKFFCVRVLYMVDVIQNRLFKGLMEVADEEDPYGEAIYEGTDQVVRESFRRLFGSFSLGALPKQALPSLFLRAAQQTDAAQDETNAGGPAQNRGNERNRQREEDPLWFRESRDPPPEGVAIPSGKSFADLFTGGNAANARDWPRTNHHARGNNAQARLCIKYVTTGKCSRGGSCNLAHKHFSQLSGPMKQQVKDRLTLIYGQA